MSEILAVMIMAGAAWFWLDALRARDVAVEAARLACAAEGVQLLDDTAVLVSLRPQRAGGGTLRLRRIYRFEFSDTGNNRLGGSVTMLGSTVLALYLDPHCGGTAGERRLV
ncbi:MAG: DUF3301 domain-containing protein [Betaproteobacteria bacterium]|nr:DUF3301 domain-containing protein [Betaproteobacteria bacterium]